MATNAQRKWLRQLKVEEYYLDRLFDDHRSMSYALYWAVIEGRVRCKHEGEVLTLREANSLRNKNYGIDYYLPIDVEISVDDAVEEFENGVTKIRAPQDDLVTSELTTILKNTVGQHTSVLSPSANTSRPRKPTLESAVRQLILELWPDGTNIGLKAKDRDKQICEAAKSKGWSKISSRTIARALKP